jgi:hypothetical protein
MGIDCVPCLRPVIMPDAVLLLPAAPYADDS